MAKDYSELIAKYAKKHGVPEKLIRQVINVESSGKADAVSPTGPVGLMQVSTGVAKSAGYSKADMYDPEKNIDAGTKYLASNLKAFNGNVSHALLGYNQGTGGARSMLSGKRPMAKEGYNYIHNKKFSPEFLNSEDTLPKPEAVEVGKGPVPAQQPKYANASLSSVAPEPPSNSPDIQSTPTTPPVQKPTEPEPRELTDAEKINMFVNRLSGVFNTFASQRIRGVDTIKRGFVDDWMSQLPLTKNNPALLRSFGQ